MSELEDMVAGVVEVLGAAGMTASITLGGRPSASDAGTGLKGAAAAPVGPVAAVVQRESGLDLGAAHRVMETTYDVTAAALAALNGGAGFTPVPGMTVIDGAATLPVHDVLLLQGGAVWRLFCRSQRTGKG